MFQGTHTALITPFRDSAVDAETFRALIERQIDAGIDGVVPVGTTGESPTVTHDEHVRLIQLAVEAARGRCKVIAGTGSNSTAKAVEMTREAEAAGADGALIVAPYYNKPSQEGLYRHFGAIAEATKLPIVLYSIPGRCGVEIGVETVRRLATDFSNVVAIKEAGGSVERVSQLRATTPRNFEILSGDDSLTLPFLAVGAVGVISTCSNLIPAEMSQLVRAFLMGKQDVARGLHERFYGLFKDLFIEPNPVPLKTALHLAGHLPSAEVRLPLCEMGEATFARLHATLESLELIRR